MNLLQEINKIEEFFNNKTDEEIKEIVRKNEIKCEQLEMFELIELNIKSQGGY